MLLAQAGQSITQTARTVTETVPSIYDGRAGGAPSWVVPVAVAAAAVIAAVIAAGTAAQRLKKELASAEKRASDELASAERRASDERASAEKRASDERAHDLERQQAQLVHDLERQQAQLAHDTERQERALRAERHLADLAVTRDLVEDAATELGRAAKALGLLAVSLSGARIASIIDDRLDACRKHEEALREYATRIRIRLGEDHDLSRLAKESLDQTFHVTVTATLLRSGRKTYDDLSDEVAERHPVARDAARAFEREAVAVTGFTPAE
ncbi:MAG: hypothetical protein JHC95_16225 [Solirubrobacteraceae bacterium]|nr:hypothetical protein [Solirubrobacteraceae bacterium]